MENNELYKIFQVTNVLITKYNFSQIIIQEFSDVATKEMWLFNLKDPNYQLVRVSYFSAKEFFSQKSRVDSYIHYFISNRNMHNLKFLDIYINNDEYDDNNEEYDFLNIEENYSDGVDLHNIYPELYTSIHHVDDSNSEIQRITSNVYKKLNEKKNNQPFFQRNVTFYTYLLIIICILLYGIKFILEQNYDSSVVAIYMGADYKLFTLGLKQYYRLITCAFVHNDPIHLFCNMISLFSIGRYVEARFGHRDFLIALFVSVLFGSLTQDILTDNGLCLGISAGIYGLFIIFIRDILNTKIIKTQALLPTIFINVYLNFMSQTAWLAHVGGAVGGFIMYQVLIAKDKDKLLPISFTVLAIVCLFVKFLDISSIKTLYIATDSKVIDMYQNLGFTRYAHNLINKLAQLYSKLGG